jgi:hypothetical protein
MKSSKELARQRRRFIVERVNAGDVIRLVDVASQFDCAEGTIYRDLTYLRKLGMHIYTKRGIIGAHKTRRVNLVREISFPPQYKEAGVAILSYFSRVLEQKYPETDASVSIIQQGSKVTLKIESDEGEIEVVEQVLSDYGAVVIGRVPASQLLPNPLDVIELKNRLEIARMELRLKEETFSIHQAASNQRIESLETQVSELRTLIGSQLATVKTLSNAVSKMATAERVSPSIAKAINTISGLLSVEHTKENEMELRKAAAMIQKTDPGFFKRMVSSISDIGHSITANIATPWVIDLLNSLPK